MKKLLITLLLAISFMLTGCVSATQHDGEFKTLSVEDATRQVDSYFDAKKVRFTTVDATVIENRRDDSWVGIDTTAEDLPEIGKYPLSVQGDGDIDVEVFSSTEKSNATAHRWLDTMAEEFNRSNATVNGQRITVSIRPIASGLALDYIKSGKYIPGAYSPANELWAEMIASAGVKTQLVEQRLTGNVAGILMKDEATQTFTEKYGDVTMESVVTAVMAGDLRLGHTDPNQSSTGLNFLTQELQALDGTNPLSAEAAKAYRQFQEKVPPASPTTAEMSKVAAKGLVNATINESQAVAVEPALATGWKFTPMGVRHDSPLYALGNASEEELDTLRQFAEFVRSPSNQALATQQGFNQYNDYRGVANSLTGVQLFGALDLWKQNKDSGVPILSMFVVDRSGSMDDTEKLARAKQALKSSAAYINAGNYVGLLSYSGEDEITLDLPVGQFTEGQRSLFVGAVNSLEARGDTATYSAVVAATKILLDAQQDLKLADAKLRIVLMTDGMRTSGLEVHQAGEVVKNLKIPVYGVGFEAKLDNLDNELNRLAQPNEAYTINADREDGPSKLKALVRGAL